jgi:hypothetical protein
MEGVEHEKHGNTNIFTLPHPPLSLELDVGRLSPTKLLWHEYEEDDFLEINTPHPQPLAPHSTPPRFW